jgi:hypothetical protein
VLTPKREKSPVFSGGGLQDQDPSIFFKLRIKNIKKNLHNILSSCP